MATEVDAAMTKRDPTRDPDKRDKAPARVSDRPVYLQRVFDSLPAQIDAIKAERERAAKELRSFVRKLEEDEGNKH
jgi:hypothetical protein